MPTASDFAAPHVMWSIRESVQALDAESVRRAAEGFLSMAEPIQPEDASFVVIVCGEPIFWTDNPTDAFIVQRGRRLDLPSPAHRWVQVRSLGEAL